MFSSDDSHPRGAEPEFEKKEVYYMPNVKNQETLVKIKEDLDGVSAMWVVDYCGLTVKDIQALRTAIRESGASLKVYKNTLMHIALEELEMASMDEILEGPSAFVFAGADPVASAKALKEFAKTNDKLEVKGGLMDGAFVNAEQVQAVADLPSREQLFGQLAGLINGFARRIAVSINDMPSSIARAVNQVAEQKPAA